MTTQRLPLCRRLTALVTLLAFIFTLVPLHAGLSHVRGSVIFPHDDNLGRRTGRTLPGGQTESVTYNRPGTVNGRTDFNGTVTAHTYDALDRLLRRRVASAAAGVAPVDDSFTYTLSGRRETMTDATGVTRYFYDHRDRLQRKETPQGALNYGHEDASGLLTNMHSDTSGGAASSYAYDDLGRLKTATDANGQVTTYGYDEVGNLAGVNLPNGVSSGYGYNEINRLQALDINRGATSLAQFSYAVAPTGHRHRSVESGSGLQPANPIAFRTRTWSYDALWRLRSETLGGGLPLGAGATMPNGIATYTLDAVGNRTARTSTIAGLTSQSFGYNPNDRISSANGGAGDTYDANGNTLTGMVGVPPAGPGVSPGPIAGTDTYDAADRLLLRTAAGNSESLAYDGDGHRVRETVTRNGVTTSTKLLVDDQNPTGYAQVVEEWTNGTLTKVFHYGHALISQDALLGADWTLAYYGYDGHGSVRFLTDVLGAVTDTYEYDAFGELLATTGATPNRHRYCGERFDENLGLYYLRARLMNPLTGRFWTADSFEGAQSDPASLHKYLYANAGPINGIDPTGHSLVSAICDLGIRLTAWTMSGSVGATVFGYSVATLNVAALVSDPGLYMSLGPIAAPEILAADVVGLLRAGGRLFSATRSALAARSGLKILSGWRTDMRIPQIGQAGGDDVTTALLEIHDGVWIGSRFKGRSPNDPTAMHPSLRPNAITRQHAEADAFNQAAWSGTTAEKATLTVDRNLCGACGRSGGVKSMAKALGIKELTVVTPAGTAVIIIDSSVTPATGLATPYGLINAVLTAE